MILPNKGQAELVKRYSSTYTNYHRFWGLLLLFIPIIFFLSLILRKKDTEEVVTTQEPMPMPPPPIYQPGPPPGPPPPGTYVNGLPSQPPTAYMPPQYDKNAYVHQRNPV